MTVEEVANLLRISPKTLYQWAQERRLVGHKFGGCLRFKCEDVEAFVERCKIGPLPGYNPFTQARGPKKGGKRDGALPER